MEELCLRWSFRQVVSFLILRIDGFDNDPLVCHLVPKMMEGNVEMPGSGMHLGHFGHFQTGGIVFEDLAMYSGDSGDFGLKLLLDLLEEIDSTFNI